MLPVQECKRLILRKVEKVDYLCLAQIAIPDEPLICADYVTQISDPKAAKISGNPEADSARLPGCRVQ